MLRDIINETFIAIFGILFLWLPVSVGYWGDWLIRISGAVFILLLLVTYTAGFRFDNKFKKTLRSDSNLGNKLPLSFVSTDWYMKLRVVRATMYARNIVLPKGTTKNWIQESWFHGYNFRKNARWFDILASYLYFAALLIFIVYGCGLAIIQMFTS